MFASVFAPFSGPGGHLDERVHTDEFVLAYMYGVMTYRFECWHMVGNKDSDAGLVLCKCYDRVFPGCGVKIVELSVARIASKEEGFSAAIMMGWKQARLHLESRGKSGLPGLTKRLGEITNRR